MKKLGQKVQGGYLTLNKKANDGEEGGSDEAMVGGSEDDEVEKKNGIIGPVDYLDYLDYLNGCA